MVPVFHRAWREMLDRPRPLAVLNLGGVANVTYVEAGGDPSPATPGRAMR